MKHSSFFNLQSSIALLTLFLVSCTKQYPVREVSLNTKVDSVSYAMAYMTGRQAAVYNRDSTGQAVIDYMSSFEQALQKSMSQSAAFRKAYSMGLTIKEYELKGVYFRKGFPLKEPVLLQAYVNGLYQDSTQMGEATARAIYEKYHLAGSPYSRLDQSVMTKRCPTSPAAVSLTTNWDSLNYMVGWVNGVRVTRNLPDSLQQGAIDGHILGLKQALRTSYAYPSMAARGYEFGTSTAQWKQTGKLGAAQVVLNLDVFQQGLINGLHQDTTMMTMPEAIKYMRSVRSDLFK